MKTKGLVVAVLMGAVLLGCPSPQVTKEKEVVAPVKRSVFSLQAEVLKVEGDLIQLRLMKPTAPKGEAKLAAALAQGVIETSYLLEGREVLLNQTRVKVARVAGDEVQVRPLDKPPIPFKAGDRLTFPLEKKLIAVKDFEVVVGQNKDAAKYVQEDVESLLVESGQFSVVERAKLGSLLEEIQLGQTGAIDPATVQKAGKLLGAEFILTGTLAATGDEWNVNLRLVNTETGLVIAAIHKMGPLHELKAESFRATKNIEGSFENGGPQSAGWTMVTMRGDRMGVGGYKRIYIDKNEGANGSKQSMAMAFKLGSERSPEFKNLWAIAWMRNHERRDVAGFKGIKFYIKGSEEFTVIFRMTLAGEAKEQEKNWMTEVVVTKDWQEVHVPFTSLTPPRVGSRVGQTVNKSSKTLDLKNVAMIDWQAHERYIPGGTEGIIWLDEVSFY